MERFEAEWTERPTDADAVNLDFARNAIGPSRVDGGSLIARASPSFALANGFRAVPVSELE